MKYFKKVFLGCLLWVLLVGVDVNAASTCDYSEQVQLSNYAAAIKMNYEKKRVYFDVNGNYYDTLPEEAYSENAGYDDYGFMDKALVNILNMTDDIYIHVKGSNNFEQTFYYKDMKD